MSFLSCTALLLKRVARFFFIFTTSTTYKKQHPGSTHLLPKCYPFHQLFH